MVEGGSGGRRKGITQMLSEGGGGLHYTVEVDSKVNKVLISFNDFSAHLFWRLPPPPPLLPP